MKIGKGSESKVGEEASPIFQKKDQNHQTIRSRLVCFLFFKIQALEMISTTVAPCLQFELEKNQKT